MTTRSLENRSSLLLADSSLLLPIGMGGVGLEVFFLGGGYIPSDSSPLSSFPLPPPSPFLPSSPSP